MSGDEWPGGGGRWIENLGHQPVWCETKSALAKEAEKRGLTPFVRHVAGSKQTVDWGSIMDPYTLEAAKALVERAGQAKASDPPMPELPVKWEIGGWTP